LFVAFLLSACGDDNGNEAAPDISSVYADVIFDSAMEDEPLAALLAQTPSRDAQKEATFTYPTEGAVIDEGDWPLISWKTASQTASWAHPKPSSLHWLWLELSGVARAQTHPVNGQAFFVLFGTANNSNLVRVFTQQKLYQPAGDPWLKMVEAGGPITGVITTATFDNDMLVDGPFIGPKVTFTVKASNGGSH